MTLNIRRVGLLSVIAIALALAAHPYLTHLTSSQSAVVASKTDEKTSFPPRPPVIIGSDENPIVALPDDPAITWGAATQP